MMTRTLACALAAALSLSLSAAAQQIEDKSYRDEDGNLVLRMEMVVEVSQRIVWDLWATDKGVSTWMAPIVKIDLRVGGIWEASYDPSKKIGDPDNIQNEILAYIPHSMLAMRVVGFPRNYPLDVQKVAQTHTVIMLEPVEDRKTKVIVCGVGYKDGPAWQEIYNTGLETTRETLKAFYRRCTRGPIIWPEPEEAGEL